MSTLAITSPSPTILFGSGWNAMAISTPVPTLAITGYVSGGSMAITAPTPEITIVVAAGPVPIDTPLPIIAMSGRDIWNQMDIRAPPPSLSMSSLNTHDALSITTPKATVSFTTGNGTMDSLAISTPHPIVAITGHGVTTSPLAITAPVPTISISMGSSTYHCTVLNTDTWEVTEYTWTFDQLVKFDDQYLGVNSTGIYLLGGSTNAGTDISATIETGLDDFGLLTSKRLSTLHVGWKSDSDAIITVTMDEDTNQSYEYDLLATNNNQDATRVMIGYPTQRRYINLKIENQDGEDFSLYSMEMLLSMSIRKANGI
jgi:hypothetical protein